jgi:squalene cyclase
MGLLIDLKGGNNMDIDLHYDYVGFILKNGSLSDKLRLIAASYDVATEIKENTLAELENIINTDGGIPFELVPGNPSSVKETAEVLPLLLSVEKSHPLIDKMMQFLVSRQKNDGGFAETLNLDPYIEDKWGGTRGRDWYPVGKSVTWLTGKALEALCLAGYDDTERISRARNYLISLQYEDGNWPDFEGQETSDPLCTGNILPALRAAGFAYNHKAILDGRAALLQHLKDSIEIGSTCDMVDLTALGKSREPAEEDLMNRGLELIVSSQNTDGGWSMIGSKKSDPELSSILGFVVKTCCR